jgi:SAM-dependent methyltransferase
MTNIDTDLDEEQEIQELQYEFPYHYIPETDHNDSFSQTKQWSWGYRYLGGIQVVFEILDDCDFDSIIDIGCGDGRFLRELNKQYPEVSTLGIDYSQRAINMANAMNPDIIYEHIDITEEKPNRQFDIACLIEVLEHIPPEDIPEFIESVTDVLCENGKLILTVPHINKSVQDKHYQHFNQEKLSRIFEDEFDILDFIYFDQQSPIIHRLQKLLGGRGSHYVITNKTIKSIFWQVYTSHYLYTNESRCGRIAMIAKKKTNR